MRARADNAGRSQPDPRHARPRSASGSPWCSPTGLGWPLVSTPNPPITDSPRRWRARPATSCRGVRQRGRFSRERRSSCQGSRARPARLRRSSRGCGAAPPLLRSRGTRRSRSRHARSRTTLERSSAPATRSLRTTCARIDRPETPASPRRSRRPRKPVRRRRCSSQAGVWSLLPSRPVIAGSRSRGPSPPAGQPMKLRPDQLVEIPGHESSGSGTSMNAGSMASSQLVRSRRPGAGRHGVRGVAS